MSNLFNGLESMGLQGLENVKIYDDEPKNTDNKAEKPKTCLLYTSPSPRDA